MKTAFFTTFLLAAVSCHATNRLLEAAMQDSKMAENWALHSQGTEDRWNWAVLTNKSKAETLSFAYQKTDSENLAGWMDTSVELFPTGIWATSRKTKLETYTNPIRSQVRTYGFLITNTLEYSFVTEVRQAQNYISHGYAFLWAGEIFFIQHTSNLPITYSFAQDTTWHVTRTFVKPPSARE